MIDHNSIKCFVKQVRENRGRFTALALLYKDARVDMDELDKRYGPMGWKDEYTEVGGNLYCTISVWDEDKKQWISKSDVGVESYIEKEKGQASDAFKRAGFKWNIMRYLYSAPTIWIELDGEEVINIKGKLSAGVTLHVAELVVEDNKIAKLVIQDHKGKVRFDWSGKDVLPVAEPEGTLEELRAIAKEKVQKSTAPDPWKEQVLSGLPTYDMSTVERLLATDYLKGV